MATKRQYKDTIFRGVFSDEKNALSLYNDISDIPVPEDTEVSIITLNNDIVTGAVNDLGMIINNKLIVLVEQQSTDNPNMPLRMLLYVAREYEQEIK